MIWFRNLDNTVSENLQISDKIMNFLMNSMESWKIELTVGGQTVAEIKILRDLFQGATISSLLFIWAMRPLNYIFRKCTSGNKFTKSQEKVNYFMNMDDIKVFAKSEKELGILIQTKRIYSQDIGMEFDIENMSCS